MSFLQNIGTDGSGVHCGTSDIFSVKLRTSYQGIPDLEVRRNQVAENRVHEFFKSTHQTVWYKDLMKKALYRYKLERMVRSL
jgi:hypothetical protein